MENKIKKNVESFIIKNRKLEEKDLEITIKDIGGLSNQNFIVTITNKTTKEIIEQILYRKFGEISDVVSRELETMIIDKLSQKGIGPKIYDIDPKGNYRIEEYLSNTSPIKKIDEFDNNILNQIIEILNNYSLIADVYKYEIINNEIIYNPIYNNDDKEHKEKNRINYNMFNKCYNEMYNKAKESFKLFSQEFKNNVDKESNEEIYKEFEKFDYYMNNYRKIFTDIFPKKGYMTLCHNDIHRLNLLIRENDKKLFLLDHEYACLNLIGNDFANYMNESCYIYEPEYVFTKDLINFDKYFGFYKNYIKTFCDNHKFLNSTDDGKKFLKEIQTKKYYLKLHVVLNLFWFLYCGIYLNFAEFYKDQKNFFYFQHGIHRIIHIETAMKEIEKLP
jgi:thiamine kinase-like enzyme